MKILEIDKLLCKFSLLNIIENSPGVLNVNTSFIIFPLLECVILTDLISLFFVTQ